MLSAFRRPSVRKNPTLAPLTRLESDGIPSFVIDDNIVRMNSLWSVAVGGARLLVPQPLAAEAREIIGLLRSGRFAIGEDEVV